MLFDESDFLERAATGMAPSWLNLPEPRGFRPKRR